MIQQTLIQILREAVAQAATELGLDVADLPEPELSRPRQKDHGDWATNVALVLAPKAGRAPRSVADAPPKLRRASPCCDRLPPSG